MTAVDDLRDTRYMVYHNKNKMNDQELVSYLQSHLSVYSKHDDMMNR